MSDFNLNIHFILNDYTPFSKIRIKKAEDKIISVTYGEKFSLMIALNSSSRYDENLRRQNEPPWTQRRAIANRNRRRSPSVNTSKTDFYLAGGILSPCCKFMMFPAPVVGTSAQPKTIALWCHNCCQDTGYTVNNSKGHLFSTQNLVNREYMQEWCDTIIDPLNSIVASTILTDDLQYLGESWSTIVNSGHNEKRQRELLLATIDHLNNKS